MILLNNYIELLKNRLKSSFDLEEDKTILGKPFDLYGEFYVHNAKYLLTKKLKYHQTNINENIYFKEFNQKINSKDIKALHNFISKNAKELVTFRENHMETILTFIYQCDFPLDNETIKAIENFKFYKSFMFGFKGWTNTRLIVVNKKADNYYSNKFKSDDNDIFIRKNN